MTTLCRTAHHVLEEGRGRPVRRAVGELARDEAVAERLRIRGESLRGAEPIAFEAIAHDGEVLPLEALADGRQVVGREAHARGGVERDRRLSVLPAHVSSGKWMTDFARSRIWRSQPPISAFRSLAHRLAWERASIRSET